MTTHFITSGIGQARKVTCGVSHLSQPTRQTYESVRDIRNGSQYLSPAALLSEAQPRRKAFHQPLQEHPGVPFAAPSIETEPVRLFAFNSPHSTRNFYGLNFLFSEDASNGVRSCGSEMPLTFCEKNKRSQFRRSAPPSQRFIQDADETPLEKCLSPIGLCLRNSSVERHISRDTTFCRSARRGEPCWTK